MRDLDCLPTLLEHFPARELEVRRLFARDEAFRGACRDFELAVKAIQHWECAEGDVGRVAEYRQLANEIEAEIAALLDAASVSRTTR